MKLASCKLQATSTTTTTHILSSFGSLLQETMMIRTEFQPDSLVPTVIFPLIVSAGPSSSESMNIKHKLVDGVAL